VSLECLKYVTGNAASWAHRKKKSGLIGGGGVFNFRYERHCESLSKIVAAAEMREIKSRHQKKWGKWRDTNRREMAGNSSTGTGVNYTRGITAYFGATYNMQETARRAKQRLGGMS